MCFRMNQDRERQQRRAAVQYLFFNGICNLTAGKHRAAVIRVFDNFFTAQPTGLFHRTIRLIDGLLRKFNRFGNGRHIGRKIGEILPLFYEVFGSRNFSSIFFQMVIFPSEIIL